MTPHLFGQSGLVNEPVSRKLRIFAFDPGVSAQFDLAGIGEITIAVPWERDIAPGPVGEYIEVVDADPASGVVYKPIDLNDQWILAQNGVAPSETNPLFHQQMVYAVARSEEHTSELQSPCNLVCRLLLEKKKKNINYYIK